MTRGLTTEERQRAGREDRASLRMKYRDAFAAGRGVGFGHVMKAQPAAMLYGALEAFQAPMQKDKFEAVCRIAEAGGGMCGCTTVEVRDIPEACTQLLFMVELDSAGFNGQYDFVFMAADMWTHVHGGCATVNFTNSAAADSFFSSFNDKVLDGFDSAKPLAVTPSNRQGLKQNIAWFQLLQAAALQSQQFFSFLPCPVMPLQSHCADDVSVASVAPQESVACTSCLCPRDDDEEMCSYCRSCSSSKTTDILLDFLTGGALPPSRSAHTEAERQAATKIESAPEDTALGARTAASAYDALRAALKDCPLEDEDSTACTLCNTKVAPDHRFCMFCGSRVNSSPATLTTSSPVDLGCGSAEALRVLQSREKKQPKRRLGITRQVS